MACSELRTAGAPIFQFGEKNTLAQRTQCTYCLILGVMINVHKEYHQAFLLEPTKLRRLVDKIHERLGTNRGLHLNDTFEVSSPETDVKR